MSVQATSWVWGRSDIPRAEKYVLLAYADHAEKDGTGIHPSVATICQKTGYSERQVRGLTANLEKLGLLVRSGSMPQGQVNWRLNMSPEELHPCEDCTPAKTAPLRRLHQGGAKSSTTIRKNRPLTVEEEPAVGLFGPIEVATKKRVAAPWKPSPGYLEASEAYSSILPPNEKSAYVPTESEQKLYYKAWHMLRGDGYDEEAAHRLIVQAVHGWAFDSWPERKNRGAHSWKILLSSTDNVRKFSGMDSDFDAEADAAIAADAAEYFARNGSTDQSNIEN